MAPQPARAWYIPWPVWTTKKKTITIIYSSYSYDPLYTEFYVFISITTWPTTNRTPYTPS